MLLIVKQILLVRTLGSEWGTVRRICTLVLGCERLKRITISKTKSGVAGSESKVQRLCYNLLARHDYNDIKQSSPI